MKKTRNVNLEEEDIELAKILGITLSELVRQAISNYRLTVIQQKHDQLNILERALRVKEE